MKLPVVSVVMSVYNADKYLAESIESILSQTFKDFEFIIINDGSKDKSKKIIESFKDPRIRFVSRVNKGIVYSLNQGVGLARAKYIARQDADDISLPSRLQKQVEYLEANQEIGMVGTNLKLMDDNGKFLYYSDLLCSSDDLKMGEVFSNQFGHGSILIRKKLLPTEEPYDNTYPATEDYDLWSRISHITKVSNLKDPLYKLRIHPESVSSSPNDTATSHTREGALSIMNREFEYYLSHKSNFKFFSFHPRSMRGGITAYLNRKAHLYRCMALMYCRHGLRYKAVPIFLLAAVHAPWVKKTYEQLFLTLTNRQAILSLEYEFF